AGGEGKTFPPSGFHVKLTRTGNAMPRSEIYDLLVFFNYPICFENKCVGVAQPRHRKKQQSVTTQPLIVKHRNF
ncbi:hypothetical protein, partial [Tolypothrix sp. PCC 7601]|uniref:hypothetical protein n=1 Tax=Tolypothrix sp. PCC 7601 TaxID=1188 RepID=UPI0005EAB5F9